MQSQHAHWIDINTGLPYTSMYASATVRGLNTYFLTTPNVLATARAYFNCSTLIGMPFENELSENGA